MIADVLTKEVKENQDLCDLVENGKLRIAHNEDAVVKAVGLELRLLNPSRNVSVVENEDQVAVSILKQEKKKEKVLG